MKMDANEAYCLPVHTTAKGNEWETTKNIFIDNQSCGSCGIS